MLPLRVHPGLHADEVRDEGRDFTLKHGRVPADHVLRLRLQQVVLGDYWGGNLVSLGGQERRMRKGKEGKREGQGGEREMGEDERKGKEDGEVEGTVVVPLKIFS